MTDTNPLIRARTLGTQAGAAAGAWVIDGRTSPRECAAWVRGYEDGDPRIMDRCPDPLSGEWADDPLSGELLDLILQPGHVRVYMDTADADTWVLWDELLVAYEACWVEAWWASVMEAATYQIT